MIKGIRRCALCGRDVPGDLICPACREKLPPSRGNRQVENLGRCASVWEYRGQVRQLMIRFKYGGGKELFELFAKAMAEKDDFSKEYLLVPVPAHPRRVRSGAFPTRS